MAGVAETRTVRQWADGARAIATHTARKRLKTGCRAGTLIAAHDSLRVVQAWFQGLNPMLDDISPVRLLVEAEDHDAAAAKVIAAARQFAAAC